MKYNKILLIISILSVGSLIIIALICSGGPIKQRQLAIDMNTFKYTNKLQCFISEHYDDNDALPSVSAVNKQLKIYEIESRQGLSYKYTRNNTTTVKEFNIPSYKILNQESLDEYPYELCVKYYFDISEQNLSKSPKKQYCGYGKYSKYIEYKAGKSCHTFSVKK